MSRVSLEYRYGSRIKDHVVSLSNESKANIRILFKIINDYYDPISRQNENKVQRFYSLVDIWQRETQLSSSLAEFVMHPAYQEIIGMGNLAIPLILAELKERPNHWFWALSSITGENPIKVEQRGKLKEMTQSWLDWGKEKGYI